jgi:hypothetical protein
VIRPVLVLALGVASPTPVPTSVAPLSPAALTAPALAPSLTPALAAAPAPALAAVPVAAAAAADNPAPGTPRAAAALKIHAAEFERLVSELMGPDREKSEAAATALRALKDDHLNQKPELEKTRILDLKPMQIPAGMIEVQSKARELRDMKAKDVEAWQKDRSVPTIEDYKGRKRPVDHHHEARAEWEADRDETYTHNYFDDELHARVKALNRDQFYAVTKAMGLFYDRDQFGAGPHDPNHLPEDVRGMADDPFRSLAWKVRKEGGYDKTDIPFAEFEWANFFRERVRTYPTKADFDKAVAEALKLAHSSEAKHLPGWKPR